MTHFVESDISESSPDTSFYRRGPPCLLRAQLHGFKPLNNKEPRRGHGFIHSFKKNSD